MTQKVPGYCLVMGPDGLVPNPMKDREEPTKVPSIHPELEGYQSRSQMKRHNVQETYATHMKKFVFPSFDLATETCRQKSHSCPGLQFHVLQTVTVFEAQTPEPQTLHFEVPK